ncbi:MAG: hypothetical protein WD022_11980 [Balneolaceae bacterium]
MNKVPKIIILFVVGMITISCSNPVNQYTTTHVKELAQSDLFGVLPESGQPVLVYENANEINGEYLELATVRIQEVSDENCADKITEQLKKEAKDLGGNGILLINKTKNEDGNKITQEMKAIAVYVFDQLPVNDQLAIL